jgi:hypothetical protein
VAATFINGTHDTTGNSLGSSIAAPSISITSGNSIIVGVSNYSSGQPDVISIADSYSNTYTRCGSVGNGDASHTMEMWIAHNVTGGGSNTITATFDANANFRVIMVAQYSGLATSNAYDSESATSITSSTLSHATSSATTTAADDLLIGFYIAWDVAVVTGATTPNYARVVGSGGALVEKIATTAGSYTVTADTSTSTQSGQVCFLKTFKIASAAETLNQHSFRFFNDDGSESASTAKAALNTNINVDANDVLRARFLIDAMGDPTGKQFQLEYRRKPSGGSFGDWNKVT